LDRGRTLLYKTPLGAPPAQYEAETNSGQSGVQFQACADVGGGQNAAFINNGSYIQWAVNAPAAGAYKLTTRSATWAAASLQVSVDGVLQTSLSLPSTWTGSGAQYQTWASFTTSAFNLTAGAHTLRVTFTSGNQNLNWVKLDPAAQPTCTSVALARTGATSSSNENAGTGAALAIDGNTGTRWSSAFSDPQWLTVDLGADRYIDRVVLSWEAAAAKDFQVQYSTNGTTFTTLRTITGAAAGPRTDTVSALAARGRYVRILGTARTTGYGYSLFEASVFGDNNASCTP
jgi:cytochrome c